MNIIVCLKRTPASTSVALDASGAVKTEGMPHAINPFDEYAVEEAVRLKEKLPGSKVVALSAGPAQADEVLRAALAVGADEAVLLCDPALHGDTMAVSHALAKAIGKISAERGGAKLVLFGKQTNDGESGHVAAAVAAWLKWPSAVSVRKFAAASESEVTVERLVEDGADTLSLPLPAAVGVTKEINEPRLPSLKGKMAAKKAEIAKWTLADVGADPAVSGGAGKVVSREPVPARGSGIQIQGATPEEQAKNLAAKLKEAKFI